MDKFQLAFNLLDATSCVLVTLLAIWTVSSRLPWFVRSVALTLVLGILFVIPAHELIIKYAATVGVIVTGLCWWRWRDVFDAGSDSSISHDRNLKPPKPQFSILSMLLITLIAACASWVAARMDTFSRDEWIDSILTGAVVGLTGLVAIRLVHARRRTFLDVAVGITWLTGCSVLLGARWYAYRAFDQFMESGVVTELSSQDQQNILQSSRYWLVTTLTTCLCLALLLLLAKRAAWPLVHGARPLQHEDSEPTHSALICRIGFLLLLLTCSTPPLAILYGLVFPPAIPVASPASPEAYFEAERSAGKIKLPRAPLAGAAATASGSRYPAQTLKEFAESHEPVFSELREILRRPFVVPVSYTEPEEGDSEVPFLQLLDAYALRLELAHTQDDLESLAQYSLDCIRLGHGLTRGTTLERSFTSARFSANRIRLSAESRERVFWRRVP